MGLPGVGRDYGGWRWAVGASLSLPLAALAACIADGHAAMEAARHGFGLPCLLQGIASGLCVAAAPFFWLKASAPTSSTRAGSGLGAPAGAPGATDRQRHLATDDVLPSLSLGGAAHLPF